MEGKEKRGKQEGKKEGGSTIKTDFWRSIQDVVAVQCIQSLLVVGD